MKPLAVLAVLMGILAMIQFIPIEKENDQRIQAIALNYALYRDAVHRYVFSGHKTTGAIATSALSLPAGWITLRTWQARIDSGCLYVWGEASSNEVDVVRELYFGTLAIGYVSNGKLEPSYGGTTSIPSFISNGNIVSVVSVE